MGNYVTSDDEYCYEDEEDFSDYDCPLEVDYSESSPPSIKAQVISMESLAAAQREDLFRIMDMLSVGEHHARALLIHFRWDVEKIFELFAESGADKIFAAAGVEVAEHHQTCATASSLTCDICIDDKPANQFTAMDCGHYFCNECWTEHFLVRINEGQAKRIKCMAHKCNLVCDDAKVKTLLNAKDSQLAEKFHRFLLESYVVDNDRVKWCPSVPHCGNAIRADELCEVECSCGLQFCFSCSSEAHSPCSCIMWERWIKKCQDESETVNWLTANTKMCPKCHKSVEKRGGCNHITCICGQSFCWVCGGAAGIQHTYGTIENHSCCRYDEVREKKANEAKRELQRYLHYYNRYKAHMDSYELEAKLREEIHQKLEAVEQKESSSTPKDCSWVSNGVDRLIKSRRILSLSYPFAYYMFDDDLTRNEMTLEVRKIKQNLFEDQQEQLEAHIEKLSMCLGETFDDYDEDNFKKLRMQVITMSTIVDSLCRKMFECIENDILGSLQHTMINIAPYNSKGAEKAIAI